MPALYDFSEDVGQASYQRKENDNPNPFTLRAPSYRMECTYPLQANDKNVILAEALKEMHHAQR